jgi:hypothetical protein
MNKREDLPLLTAARSANPFGDISSSVQTAMASTPKANSHKTNLVSILRKEENWKILHTMNTLHRIHRTLKANSAHRKKNKMVIVRKEETRKSLRKWTHSTESMKQLKQILAKK